jgi:hypothetical protein
MTGERFRQLLLLVLALALCFVAYVVLFPPEEPVKTVDKQLKAENARIYISGSSILYVPMSKDRISDGRKRNP